MELTVILDPAEQACCGEALTLGQQVVWQLAYATRGAEPYYMRDQHELFSHQGAAVRPVAGRIMGIRELRIHSSRADGTPVRRVWRSIPSVPQGTDYDSDGLEVVMLVDDSTQLPELFSWPHRR